MSTGKLKFYNKKMKAILVVSFIIFKHFHFICLKKRNT